MEATGTAFEKSPVRDAKYWKIPFVRDGQTLSLEQAMLLFRDKTDRAGPSTWELANYPAGEDDYPVSGVSSYEAAAYAQFAGKSLPTVFHWYRAADMGRFSDILQTSNFAGKGPAKSGSYPSLGPFGTFTGVVSGSRLTLLMGTNESLPSYIFPRTVRRRIRR